MARTVDIHTHVFNGGYLPLAGILQQKFGLPKWTGRAIEHLIHDRLAKGPIDCSEDEPTGPGVFSSSGAVELSGLEEEDLIDIILGPPGGLAASFISEPEFDDELDAAAWAHFVSGDGVTALGFDDVWRRLLRVVGDIAEKGKALLKWLAILVGHECDVVTRLHNTVQVIDVYVHHMMDMASFYPGKPYYAFWDEQTDRMRSLAAAPESKLIGFVAFDPRRPNGVAKIEEALKSGFAGVKFYPPNGYKPIDNLGEPEFDKRCNELFELCRSLDSPVFAHCTNAGFEARPGYGRFSDPLGWKKVLDNGHKDLRLCLGHAGGASDWLSSSLGPYARTVVELCQTYDNVFCEMGHFEEVIDHDFHLVLRKRLSEVLQIYPALGEKIMFGSDWHVVALGEKDIDEYVGKFEQVFDGPLAPLKDRFFGENAIDYINLQAFVTNSGQSLSDTEVNLIGALTHP